MTPSELVNDVATRAAWGVVEIPAATVAGASGVLVRSKVTGAPPPSTLAETR